MCLDSSFLRRPLKHIQGPNPAAQAGESTIETPTSFCYEGG